MDFVLFIIFGGSIMYIEQYNVKKFNLININFKFQYFYNKDQINDGVSPLRSHKYSAIISLIYFVN